MQLRRTISGILGIVLLILAYVGILSGCTGTNAPATTQPSVPKAHTTPATAADTTPAEDADNSTTLGNIEPTGGTSLAAENATTTVESGSIKPYENPAQASLQQAIALYQAAGKKTKNAQSYTATKVNDSQLVSDSGGKVIYGFNVDNLMSKGKDGIRKETTEYQRSGNTYASTQTNANDNTYKEFGVGDTIQFENKIYRKPMPSGTGTMSADEVAHKVKMADWVKLGTVSTPLYFLPLAGSKEITAITATDVKSYQYKLDSKTGEATISFQLKDNTADKIMHATDAKAMRENPIEDSYIGIDISFAFNSLQMRQERVFAEVKINREGYMTALRVGYNFYHKNCKGNVRVKVPGTDTAFDASIQGYLYTSYTIRDINRTPTPTKHFK